MELQHQCVNSSCGHEELYRCWRDADAKDLVLLNFGMVLRDWWNVVVLLEGSANSSIAKLAFSIYYFQDGR